MYKKCRTAFPCDLWPRICLSRLSNRGTAAI